MQVFSSWFADFLRKNQYLSTRSTRKILNTAGLLLPTVFIVGAGYTGCDHTLAVVLLTLAVGSAGMTMPGYSVNHLDIAPKFAGVLLGITNSLATIPGFLAPIVVGVLTNHNETSEQWRIIFFMTAGILVTGAVFFAVLAQGDEMSWARKNAESGKWTQIIPEPGNIQGADYSPVHGKEQ
ncbi:sialin-like [Gigantopelta aegis]|uniref:sialin-like n=1 Tax=Gigantopelta aegis TaxID=1735272 RepID=UPI001B8894E7|nr:sialin-like [Gigantopelta aegis]